MMKALPIKRMCVERELGRGKAGQGKPGGEGCTRFEMRWGRFRRLRALLAVVLCLDLLVLRHVCRDLRLPQENEAWCLTINTTVANKSVYHLALQRLS